ncbi:hypothetical protein [Actinoplanes sp. NBRC 101535]|uniref:hypothetical protein n=1 Tax=Actinoplanes sp. NBRC 101535 TaxID=3032196 RepID=UPI0024A52053|nr:hypothetical protein [Actinoplanes sp. NBRC 101535]GLY04470.1 hypothetical protein Acsp01_48490 [Actinoplanes sp. NBRC 101535]
MMDLQERLRRFGGTVETTVPEMIAADIVRGRRAVRRRRAAQAATGAAVAAVAAFTFTTVAGQPAVPGARSTAESVTGGLALVDYRGEQPKYFTIAKVPEGYFIQNDDETGLMIAPDRARNPGPDVDPSKDTLYDPRFYTDKIGIFLERSDYRGPQEGDTVTVAGRPAVVHPIGDTTQLIIAVSDRVSATIQADVPITRAQLLELGEGLTVSREAIDRMGAATGKAGK